MVVWLIGLSGSGKTTLGMKLKKYCDEHNINSFVIDGDWVRDFYEGDLGYSREDRVSNVKRIILAGHVLSANGVVAIVCNISPFEELRSFCRRKVSDYNQIYLKRSIHDCRKNDIKNVYRDHQGKTDLVGVDVQFDEPEGSDLVINVEEENEDRSFERLLGFLKKKYPDKFN